MPSAPCKVTDVAAMDVLTIEEMTCVYANTEHMVTGTAEAIRARDQ